MSKGKANYDFCKCYKFRIYPNEKIEDKIYHQLNACRSFYNFLVGYTSNTYKLFGSKHQSGWTQWLLNYWKTFHPEFSNCYSSCIQYENWKLRRQIKSLYSNKKNGNKVGRLKFAKRDFFNSFTYNSQGFKLIHNSQKRVGILSLSKIGSIKIRIHREMEGTLKNIIIKREGTKWFVFLQTGKLKEEELNIKLPIPKGKRIGIDLGLKDFTYDSDNHNFKRPKILNIYASRIAYFQNLLSKCKKGSKHRERIKKLLSNVYAKQTRVREDYLHKISNYYVENYDIIFAENLRPSEMVKKDNNKNKTKGLRKNILDASWSKFLSMLEYKSKERRKLFIKVPAKNTTQTCSKCGNIKGEKDKLQLKDRIYFCYKCGLELHRDYNAALNILNKGNIILTQELGSQRTNKKSLKKS